MEYLSKLVRELSETSRLKSKSYTKLIKIEILPHSALARENKIIPQFEKPLEKVSIQENWNGYLQPAYTFFFSEC